MPSLRSLFQRNKWRDADEYQRARWAYEGQGVASTKAAWVLGGCLVATTLFAAVAVRDRHELASTHERNTLVVETNRTSGDIVSVSSATGTLVLDETKRRQFARYWLGLWRTVPTRWPSTATTGSPRSTWPSRCCRGSTGT
jgi:hypothetical protein